MTEEARGGGPNVRWRFYVTAAGSEVARSELDQLDRDALAAAMKRCAAGHLHQGDVSRIDSDIDELRVSLGPRGGGLRLARGVNMFVAIGRRDSCLIDNHDQMPSSDDQTRDVTFGRVVAGLDPVMSPLGFAGGQGGFSGNTAQVIYCSIHPSGDGRCADVVLDLRRTDGWRIVAVSYDGFHDDHVEQLRLREDVGLPEQLETLRTTIPDDLNQWTR